jgi:hypothetical protein
LPNALPLKQRDVRSSDPGDGTGCRKARKVMDENCMKIKKMLELYRAGKLTDEEKADVEYHLLYCPECIFLLTLVPSYGAD